MGLIEGVPVALLSAIISMLGLPGAVLVLWYVDNRRYERQEKKRDREVGLMAGALKEETGRLLIAYKDDMSRVLASNKEDINRILAVYKDDVSRVTRFYEDNVLLVKNYQKLADELAGIITLNTQVQTQLVEKIKANMFCPVIREKGPQG